MNAYCFLSQLHIIINVRMQTIFLNSILKRNSSMGVTGVQRCSSLWLLLLKHVYKEATRVLHLTVAPRLPKSKGDLV